MHGSNAWGGPKARACTSTLLWPAYADSKAPGPCLPPSQVYSRGQTSPLTEFFFWPRKDAWEELKAALEARPWVSER